MPNLKVWGERELSRLKNDMQRLFDSLCVDYGLPGMRCRGEHMDLNETAERVVVRLHVPGLEPENITVNVTEMGLSIAGHRAMETEAGHSSTTFSRRLGLPCRVLPGQVTARLHDDVLTIDLPKCTDNTCTNVAITKE